MAAYNPSPKPSPPTPIREVERRRRGTAGRAQIGRGGFKPRPYNQNIERPGLPGRVRSRHHTKHRRDAGATDNQEFFKSNVSDSGPDRRPRPVALGWLWSAANSRQRSSQSLIIIATGLLCKASLKSASKGKSKRGLTNLSTQTEAWEPVHGQAGARL
jgi:hypothetical protein